MPQSYLEAVIIGASKKPDSLDASTDTASVTSYDNTPNEKIRLLKNLVEQGKQAEEELRQLEAARLEEVFRQRLAREEDARQYIQRQREEYDNMTPEERRKHDEEEELQFEEEAKWHEQYDKEKAAHERRRRCYPHLNLRPFDNLYDSEDEFEDDTAKSPMSPMTLGFYDLIGDTLYAMDLESERRGYNRF